MTNAGSQKKRRAAVLDMPAEEFRELGHRLVDEIADFYAGLARRAVTAGQSAEQIRALLGDRGLPQSGSAASDVLERAADLVIEHSLHNGHPRFFGYITSSAAPLGALGDLLAAAVNPNVGGWQLSPVATEIECQTIRWIAELIGYSRDAGGIMVSGGNMANIVAFFAARKAKTDWEIREGGLGTGGLGLRVYCSRETHTWVQKAADLSGLGTDAIRWVDTDAEQRMDPAILTTLIREDRANGMTPFLVVGTAGTVSTGAIDPLAEIASLCRAENLWFHVDGAYGAPAAVLPELAPEFEGLARADSVALDPHKWLYSPLEAACTLVRDPRHLPEAFSFSPDYYQFDEGEGWEGRNFYEYGMQNSRGFRALKVWLLLLQAGRGGYEQMIRDDIALAHRIYAAAEAHPELEAVTCGLSIATFRFVPESLDCGAQGAADYLNELNRALVIGLQRAGEVFVSNAVIGGRYLLRACIVNFRTRSTDCDALAEIVAASGRRLDREMRPSSLA
jgi:glutamate/tyrosine decarboxylase-like PLP-dependent enzyme